MKQTRKKHNAVIKAKGWWWRRSGDRTIAELASEFGIHRACWEKGVSKSVVLSDGGPRVRIHLPPAESQSLAGLCRRGPRTPAFSAGVPGCVPGAVGRDPRGPPTCANPRKYLSQAIFQYRISGDAIATSCRAKASRLSPTRSGFLWARGCWWILRVREAQAKPSAVR
jgi:hypothetical protein